MTDSSSNTTKNRNEKPDSIDAIFFDAGNTLLKAKPSVASIYHRVASGRGINRTADEIERAFEREWQRVRESSGFMSEAAGRGQQVEKSWWKEFVRRVFERFGPVDDFDGFFDELYDTFARPESWELFPEVEGVLSELHSRGYKLGIISNWDSRLTGILHGLEIDRFLSEIVISSQVGFEKPDARIFLLAAERIGKPPAKVAHVGDDPVLDYRGALEAGLIPFLLDRAGGDHRDLRTISDLSELLDGLKSYPSV